ncbi:hypothetical protein Tco_0941919 [Tanacetum coccineum]|uniref:Uncharacterized protein n=1 Tax=Tanacetum coccineum TaxID=301880 RepID=A0ABQ5DYY2_9ASTR
MLLAKQDEAGVTLTDEYNDFLIADATRMEEIKELSANICLMARIQPANIDSDAGPSYDYAFLSEVQKPSTSYVNPLFAKDNQEQKYLKQPKIINDTIGDDKIDSNIIFDEPNVDVNSGSVEYDNNVFEMTKGNNTTFFNEFIDAKSKARRLEKDLQTQFIRDRDIIGDLEQKQDNLQLSAVELKRQIVELQKTQTILKRKMSENEDKYHDTVLDLEAKAKDNENVVLKIGRSLKAMFMLGPKLMSFYDPNLKHGLGYENPYTIKKAISHNPKIYDASCFNDTKIHVNVRDTEDILDDATNKLSAKQKYFSSTFIPSENPSNARASTSPSETKPPLASMPSSNPMKLYLEKMENEFTTLFALLQTNSKREIIFYTTLEEIQLTKFCQQEVKPILHKLHLNFEIFQKRFSEDIKEMKDVFDSTESDLSATWKQNELLNDQLLEAKLKHEIECCLLLSHECVNNNVQDEIEKIQRDSIEIQEGMQK